MNIKWAQSKKAYEKENDAHLYLFKIFHFQPKRNEYKPNQHQIELNWTALHRIFRIKFHW